MKIFLNGERAECGEGATVSQLMGQYGLPREATLVEHNGVALRRKEWEEQRLQENDRVEVLRVAAGG
ncbi:hypothetical protein BH18VER2_BH18VER2_02990 [soil metagenome]